MCVARGIFKKVQVDSVMLLRLLEVGKKVEKLSITHSLKKAFRHEGDGTRPQTFYFIRLNEALLTGKVS